MEPTVLAAGTAAQVRHVAEGEVGFEKFFRAENPALYRRLWLVTGNRSEAEDITQESFLKLWERWDRVGEIRDPTGYLYRTAMNIFRRRYRRGTLAIRKALAVAPTQDEFEQADDRQVVRRTLATLTPRQRAALVLTEMLGFSSEEAGRALGIKASTVRALAHQGRAAFARAMGGDDA
jgi:RNA polymerase sigma-70 factor, ECF subfamily